FCARLSAAIDFASAKLALTASSSSPCFRANANASGSRSLRPCSHSLINARICFSARSVSVRFTCSVIVELPQLSLTLCGKPLERVIAARRSGPFPIDRDRRRHPFPHPASYIERRQALSRPHLILYLLPGQLCFTRPHRLDLHKPRCRSSGRFGDRIADR